MNKRNLKYGCIWAVFLWVLFFAVSFFVKDDWVDSALDIYLYAPLRVAALLPINGNVHTDNIFIIISGFIVTVVIGYVQTVLILLVGFFVFGKVNSRVNKK